MRAVDPIVAKYPIIGLNHDDDDVNLKPGWCREIWNAIPKNGYSKTGIQNLKGSLVRTNGSLAAGTNTCIGAFADKPNNRIVYFIHNSNDDHSIWYFSPITNTHTLILQTEFLLFDTAYPILSCDFIEDVMEWTDNNNESRSIIVSRAVANLYNPLASQEDFELKFSRYKFSPSFPPTSTYPREVGTSGFNNITADSFQFCVQYVYYDNTESLISPLSKINQGDTFPLNTNTRNKIVVTHNVVNTDFFNPNGPSNAPYRAIKKIYWIYLKNDDGNFQLFKETDLDTVDPTRINATHTVDFYGTETVQTIFPTQVNLIPLKSKNTVIHDQRSIITMNEFDYEGTDVTLSVVTEDIITSPFVFFSTYFSINASIKILAPSSSYTVGVLFFDRFGRTPGITGTQTFNTPDVSSGKNVSGVSTLMLRTNDNLHARWTLAATPPTWAKTFAIALKPNNTLETGFACMAFPMFYIQEGNSDGDLYDNGASFQDTLQNSWTKQIYWKLPINLPFTVNESCKLRLLNDIGQTVRVENILKVRGDLVVTENFGVTNWATVFGGASSSSGMVNVMIELYKEEPDELFFEIGDHIDCSLAASLQTPLNSSGLIEGDYYYMESKLQFSIIESGNVKYGGTLGDVIDNDGVSSGKAITAPVISRSPTHALTTAEDVKQTRETTGKGRRFFKKALGLVGGIASAAAAIPGVGGIIGKTATTAIGAGGVGALGVSGAIKDSESQITEVVTIKLSYTPDYNKIANDSGRGWIDVKNKQVSYEPNTLSISDPYIINSKINGISNYRNLYQLPISRTPIRKMVSIGASHVLLLIHERSTTSVATYNGRVLNTSDGSQIIGDGNDIVGYNNELAGGYGTIYPDSVAHHYGRVWYFDPFSGEVIRYSNNGLTPIGSVYKMHNFFREKGDQFIDPTGRNVIAGYDANLDILYLTFRSTTPSEEITVAFVDRQGEERWICFTNFLPERYAYINEKLYAFVSGVMWEMSANDTRNLFFGVQYTTSVKHLFNTEVSREKMLQNVNPESNKRWVFDPIITERHNPVTEGKIEQETSLAKSNFIRRDNGFYADLKRDKNTPAGLVPAGKSALVAGQPLIGKVYEVTLENDDTELVELDFLNYGYIPQSGHNVV